MDLALWKITPEMNFRLCPPIKLEELEQVLKIMANKNVPRPDGIIIEFLKSFWS
jgi:hypothetical protein